MTPSCSPLPSRFHDFTAPYDISSQLELQAFCHDAGDHPQGAGMTATQSARLTPDAWVGLHLGASSNHLEVRFLAVDSAAAILALRILRCVMTRSLQNGGLVWSLAILVLVCHDLPR